MKKLFLMLGMLGALPVLAGDEAALQAQLRQAVLESDLAQVRTLIVDKKVDPNGAPNPFAGIQVPRLFNDNFERVNEPAFQAATHGEVEILEFLAEKGADVKFQKWTFTPNLPSNQPSGGTWYEADPVRVVQTDAKKTLVSIAGGPFFEIIGAVESAPDLAKRISAGETVRVTARSFDSTLHGKSLLDYVHAQIAEDVREVKQFDEDGYFSVVRTADVNVMRNLGRLKKKYLVLSDVSEADYRLFLVDEIARLEKTALALTRLGVQPGVTAEQMDLMLRNAAPVSLKLQDNKLVEVK